MRLQLAIALSILALVPARPAGAQLAPGPDVYVLQREVLGTGLFNLYSAETTTLSLLGPQQMWLGGWSRPADLPRDRIFRAKVKNGAVKKLAEVLRMPKALVNDPTVVPVPGSTDLRMYFTRLSFADLEHPTESNTVWTARSADRGLTWTDVQEAIGQLNGVNTCGAWSPSVLVERDQFCVYYHGNSPCLGVYRTCFEPDGVTVARPTEALTLPFGLANVDVSYQDGRYIMVGDLLGLSSFVEIHALESRDGVRWVPLRGTANGLLVRAGEGVVFTPHISARLGNAMILMFSTRPSLATVDDDNTLHRWTIFTIGLGG